ncbi:MAG: hypothetical protein HGB26_03015 [Desulfobulbaceae bacterium]|nr:hypothetical protein [Desulfobulbaceae bacterium]
MGTKQGYTVPEELALILKPIPADMVRLVTLKTLQVRGFWLRPVMGLGMLTACPCCAEISAHGAFGICGGCYETVVRDALFGPALLDHLASRAEIAASGGENMGLSHKMPAQLSELLLPIPPGQEKTITVSGLAKYWSRPLIKSGKKSPCPCCGGVHQLKSGGICSGCYSDKVIKNKLIGHALLEHLAIRASGGIGRGRQPGTKFTKKSTSPASEPSSPAASPLAGAGQVESKEQQVAGLEGVAVAVAIRIAMGLDSKTSLRDLPPLIGKLVADHDYLSEEMNKVVELLSPADDEDLDQTVRRMASEASAVIQERDNLAEKLVELTQEVASLNRVLAREPIRESSVTIQGPRDTCESILGILGIGNGFALMGHTSEDEDLEAITAGLIRGAIADGVWRADAIAAKELTEQDIVAKWSALPVPDGYESLAAVLHEALDQAAHGKGLERHADARPFHDQPIMRETQAVGLGYPAGQARKKILEAVRCCHDHPARAIADLLGAINYTAALVIAIRTNVVEQAA